MGLTAEKVAERWKVSREAQDAFALESHRARDGAARRRVQRRDRAGRRHRRLPDLATGEAARRRRNVALDEGPRPDTSLEGLAKLKPVFAAQGQRHRRQQLADLRRRRRADPREREGGEAVQLDAARTLRQLRRARRAAGNHGHRSERGDSGRVAAAGLTLDDIDWIELNEAFAAQSLAVIKTLGLDPAKINPLGGAIALGHPLGATGAIRAATVVHGLRRRNYKYGMVTMCVGTGMGAAGIFERL